MGVIESDGEAVQFVRFQSPHRNSRGHFTGVFGLVTTVGTTPRTPNPSTIDPDV